MNKFLGAAVAALILGGASSAFAGSGNPANDSATATATVISPLSVTKVTDLAFGKIVSGTTSGHVIIAADAGGARTNSGGVTLVTSTTGSASFTIGADATAAYNLTITPSTSGTLVHSTGSNPDLTWAVLHSTLPLSGAGTVYIGGDVTVPAGTLADTYTGTVMITAQYQ